MEIVPFGNKYKITIPLELDLSVFQQNVFAFDIGIEFTNSFGENQRQIFYGCTIKFTKTEFDSIPEEYFDISKETNGNVILYGLKDSVSELEAGAYNTLSVPEGVTHIDD
ncbi:MAG: hypothetical protein MJ233_00240 [Mycoplasmoidaceae bacterium]|nr:hypothetical protein [Mycoplasmoidaceae bacterium]